MLLQPSCCECFLFLQFLVLAALCNEMTQKNMLYCILQIKAHLFLPFIRKICIFMHFSLILPPQRQLRKMLFFLFECFAGLQSFLNFFFKFNFDKGLCIQDLIRPCQLVFFYAFINLCINLMPYSRFA